MAYTQIVQLEIVFNGDFENLGQEIGRVIRPLCRRHWRLSHAKRTLTLAIMTTETPDQLLQRMRPTLDGIHAVVDYWCSMAPKVVFAKYGEMDPTRSLLKAAWNAARELNYPQYLKNA